jgi:predicted AlkP superfamily pyrophosphatase or phosphodiesterase
MCQPVEGASLKESQMSPKNMLATTFGDELRISTNKRSKVIGISIKDRGAILPAGHLANYALWFSNEGTFISSNYYGDKLPSWVTEYNKTHSPAKYVEKPWETIRPITEYASYATDDNSWEGKFAGETKTSFPHDLKAGFEKSKYDVLRYTPFGNTILKDIAIEALKKEELGKDEFTDLLAVSFSSPDYVGHRWGPSSVELEDTYIRLDKDIEELLSALETAAGKGNFLVFLTADHAAPEAPHYLSTIKVPSGSADRIAIANGLKAIYHKAYGDSLISSAYNQQIFFKQSLIKEKNLDYEKIKSIAVEYLSAQKGMLEVYSKEELHANMAPGKFMRLIREGYHPTRSGDIVYNYEPLWMELDFPGTTHGSPYSYDTHVPLFFYGFNVPAGSTVSEIDITDIAPTICQFMNIGYPSGCLGKPIKELFNKKR